MSELYELPNGWEWKKLGSLSTTTSGGTPKRNEKSYWNGNIGWLKSGELNDGYIDKVEELITEEGLKKSSAKLFQKGTLLIAMYGATVGKLGILDIETTTNQAICGILNDKKMFITKYMFYFLKSIKEKMLIDSFGGAQPNLSQTYIKDIDIPLPPLSEQQRIVSKLDLLFEKIDKAIALHQKNIDEANVFMGSVLNDVFGELKINKTIPLKDITTKIGSGATPSGGQKAYKTEGISLIRSMNVHDNGFRIKGLAFIDGEQAKKLDNVTIEENDILLNITGASVARCCIVDKDYLPARVNQHVSILRLKDGMIPSFLHYYLISPSIKSDLLFSSSGGATREAITKSMLEEFQVTVVSLSIQQKTVKYLNEISQKIEKVKSVQKEKMANLKALKASILDSAFRGAL